MEIAKSSRCHFIVQKDKVHQMQRLKNCQCRKPAQKGSINFKKLIDYKIL